MPWSAFHEVEADAPVHTTSVWPMMGQLGQFDWVNLLPLVVCRYLGFVLGGGGSVRSQKEGKRSSGRKTTTPRRRGEKRARTGRAGGLEGGGAWFAYKILSVTKVHTWHERPSIVQHTTTS